MKHEDSIVQVQLTSITLSPNSILPTASPMDKDIVEEFLLAKLGEVIAEAKTKEKANKLSKVWSAAEECEQLKELIKAKERNNGAELKHRRREKLYDLLNVMAEWLQLLEKRLPNWEEAAKCLCGLRARTAKIKKDLEVKIKKDLQYTAMPMGESEQGDGHEFPENLEIYRRSCHAVDVDKIHGFNDEMMIMKRLLLEKGSKVIVIVGAAGVGKTALSQVSFNNDEVQEKFLFRIWLCLSKQQKFDPPYNLDVLFVKRILSCLGLEDDVIEEVRGGDQPMKVLQLALQRELKRGEHLIVLDDVCKIEEDPKIEEEEKPKMGEMIQQLFSLTKYLSQYRDGTVIVTSRYGNLEEKGGPNNMHRLKLLPLADKDCWKIFSVSVGNGELETLKSKILDKCEGLPLMAKMLGEIAHGQAHE